MNFSFAGTGHLSQTVRVAVADPSWFGQGLPENCAGVAFNFTSMLPPAEVSALGV